MAVSSKDTINIKVSRLTKHTLILISNIKVDKLRDCNPTFLLILAGNLNFLKLQRRLVGRGFGRYVVLSTIKDW